MVPPSKLLPVEGRPIFKTSALPVGKGAPHLVIVRIGIKCDSGYTSGTGIRAICSSVPPEPADHDGIACMDGDLQKLLMFFMKKRLCNRET